MFQLSYIMFLLVFAYVAMLKKEGMPTVAEFLLIIYIISLTIAEVDQVKKMSPNLYSANQQVIYCIVCGSTGCN